MPHNSCHHMPTIVTIAHLISWKPFAPSGKHHLPLLIYCAHLAGHFMLHEGFHTNDVGSSVVKSTHPTDELISEVTTVLTDL